MSEGRSRPKKSHIEDLAANSCDEWVYTLCGHLLRPGAFVPNDEASCGNCRRIWKAKRRKQCESRNP